MENVQMNDAISFVVEIAKQQIGIVEGENNWNIYAADPRMREVYGWDVQCQPYCGVFVNWLFVEAYGAETGKEMTHGASPSCYQQAELYRQAGAWSTEPHVGDQIFLLSKGRENHTGFVIEVNGNDVITVEGNWSDKVSVVHRNVNASDIAGYGVPDWSLVSEEEKEDSDIIHHRQRTFFRLEYGDGVATKEHPDIKPLPQVKAWQALLMCWGYDLGKYGADGEFGKFTDDATRQWQNDAKAIGLNVEVNGVVDEDDWREIIEVSV